MSYPAYGLPGATTVDRDRALLGQVMGLVSLTVAFAAGGAYLGRNLAPGVGLLCTIAGFVAILALRFARSSITLGVAILIGLGTMLGLGIGPVLSRYASLQGGSTLIAQAAAGTALFIGAFGAYGYATRRDLSHWARTLFFALLALIGFGLIGVFVAIPHAQLIYAIAGLGIFAAYTMFDFNRLKRAQSGDAVFIAASIFLDVLNVFLLLLSLMSNDRR